MKQQQLIWLGGALVLLLAIAFLTGVFDSDFSTVDVPAVEIPADDVTVLRAAGADRNVALEKQNGVWRLTEPVAADADSTAVADLLKDLSTLQLQNVVSTNPERYVRFGVDSAATELTVRWEGGSRSIVVGNRNAESQYVRIGGDEAVYQTAERLRVPEEVADWRDKTIVDLQPDDVRRVSIVGPDRFIVLERENDLWKAAAAGEPMQADSAAIQRYLDRFHPLIADGFVEAAPASSDSSYAVLFVLGDGAERRLELTPSANDYAVRLDGGETVYALRLRRLAQVAPEASAFTSR